MRVSAEGLKELRANLAKRTIAALDEREGRQARDYGLAREVDAGLTVGEVLAIVDDLDESREALEQIIDEAHSSERNSVDSLIEIIDIAGKALAATEATSG